MIEVTTKDGGKMIWCMDKANYIFLMVKYNIKDNGPKINLMDGVYYMLLLGKYGKDIKEKWWMVICMDEGRFCLLMGRYLMGRFRMGKYVAEGGEYQRKDKY